MGRLFWKFFFSIWIAQLIAVLAISAGIWVKDRNHARRLESIDGSPPASTMLDAAAATLRHGGSDALRELLRGMNRHQVYAFDTDNREVLARSLNPQAIEEARRLLQRGDNPRNVREIVAADGRAYLLFVPRPARQAALMQDNARPGPPASGERPPPRGGPGGPRFPFMPMLLAMLASLVSAALLAWHFSKPIRVLRHAFAAAARGDLEARVTPTMGGRRDELTDLGSEFDRMAGQLHSVMAAQRRLLHDVSHELRSPLARMQAAIGLARQSPDKTGHSLERIERESMRMDVLVGELLTLSRLQAGAVGPMDEEVHLGELVADIVDDACYEAQAQGKRVLLADRSSGIVKGNTELLHRAIENVIRNAVKHTADATQIDVLLTQRKESGIAICISDHGPGVPAEELDGIFHPFFRRSRTAKNTDGHGLGLAIAKRIIESHGGSIRASNLEQGGLKVDIFLPLSMLR